MIYEDGVQFFPEEQRPIKGLFAYPAIELTTGEKKGAIIKMFHNGGLKRIASNIIWFFDLKERTQD